MSLTLATEHAHLPVDMDLYLLKSWADDRKRCRAAKIPDDVEYRPKWKLALEMVDRALEAGLPRGVMLADADYGQKSEFRDGLDARGLEYAVAVHKTAMARRVHGRGRRRAASIQSPTLGVIPGDSRLPTSPYKRCACEFRHDAATDLVWVHGVQ